MIRSSLIALALTATLGAMSGPGTDAVPKPGTEEGRAGSAAEAPSQPDPVADFRTDLQRLAGDGSWWFASNAEYQGPDDPAEGYGTRYWTQPGGISASGCLWSIRDGRPAAVHWIFYQAWDFDRGVPFLYQAHSSGTGTGMGHETFRTDTSSVAEQTFRWADGTGDRIMHRNDWPDDDTHVTSTATWIEGRWEPRRTYTWERRAADGALPCGPEG